LKVTTKFYFILLILSLLFNSCGIGDPDSTESYDSIEFKVGSSSYLFSQIDQAKTSVYLAVREINQSDLILYLNNAASRGLDVRLVVDSEYSSSTAGLYTNIGISYGNSGGDMTSNFAIIDNKEAVFLSTSLITNTKAMYIKIRDVDMMAILNTEFNQMYTYNRFAAGAGGGSEKLELNYQTIFPVNQDTVELYFLPQNNLFNYMLNRMGQTRSSVYSLLSDFDNSTVFQGFYDQINAGINNNFRFGVSSASSISNYIYFFNGQDTKVLAEDIPYNVIILDANTPYQTLIFTSFPLSSESTLENWDGICLMISGPSVENFYQAVRTDYHTAASVSGFDNIVINTTPAYTNIIISEVNWAGAYSNSGTSCPNGEFIELRNMFTNQYIDISGFTLSVTNTNGNTRSYTIPDNAVIPPDGFYVISKSKDYYSYYQQLWTDMSLYNSGFSITLFNKNLVKLDHIGVTNVLPLAGTSTSPRRTMVRVLSPVTEGTNVSAWVNCTTKANINTGYENDTFATPGSD